MGQHPFQRRLITRAEALDRPSAVPAEAGVYGWCFEGLPSFVPLAGSIRLEGKPLLYVGIAPSRPPGNGKAPSRQTLRSRIRYHYRGNAEGSTLRLTLGCLLSETLGIALRRVGSGQRLTFTQDGEARLSRWMAENAFVTWQPMAEPWATEDRLIATLSLPLNLHGNRRHSFCATLAAYRLAARERARKLPAVR